MTSRIRVLSDHTINKIAAGEVIENPASVVKELVENALDAGSTEICVEIKGGGRQLIRVTDNGCGMGPDDALLCLERHATSKIREVEDIHALDTMGFRGEAIPSIAAISKFTLLTCPSSQETSEGTMVIVDGGKIHKCCPAACSPGTTIEVKSLFFNVPVRKKFQRSPAHDTNEILKIMSSFALGYPEIKFDLISNQTSLLSATVSSTGTFLDSLGERIASILGHDFFKAACPLELTKGPFKIQGFIGLPSFNRHNRTGQTLFINKRAVFSHLVNFGVREGYGTTLSSNRHPVYVLHLQLPGTLVDVNVHPQKREVRLRQEHDLKQMIAEAVETALQESGVATFKELGSPAAELPWEPSPAPLPSKPAFAYDFRQPFADFPKSREEAPAAPSPPPLLFRSVHQQQAKTEEQPQLPEIAKHAKPPAVIATIPRYIVLDPTGFDGMEHPLAAMKSRSGLCLVDQKAARSRVIYERLLSQREAKGSLMEIQTLLIPHTWEASPLEAALLRENLAALNDMGIQIKEFGQTTFLVDGIPEVFGNIDIHELLHSLLKSMQPCEDSRLFHKEQEKKIAMAAAKSAAGFDKKLSFAEAQALVDQLFACGTPFQCPQGKSTIVHLSAEDLAKQFQK